jgi:hypothetical protein
VQTQSGEALKSFAHGAKNNGAAEGQVDHKELSSNVDGPDPVAAHSQALVAAAIPDLGIPMPRVWIQ